MENSIIIKIQEKLKGYRMKNLLLISFYFNQKNEIASKRLRNLSKYLPNYGWNPIVITPHFDNIDTSFNKTELEGVEIIETEYLDMLDRYSSLLKFNKSKKRNLTSSNFNKTVNKSPNNSSDSNMNINNKSINTDSKNDASTKSKPNPFIQKGIHLA